MSYSNPNGGRINYLWYLLIGTWALFCGALIAWWLIFGLEQLETIRELGAATHPELVRHQKMLFWEAGTLMLCIFLAGMALVYFMAREVQYSRKIRLFFATFAHELKTPLASLRLQVESLQTHLKGDDSSELLSRIASDTVRLNMQLENSMLFAGLEQLEMRPEKISISSVLEELRPEWIDVSLGINGDAILWHDRRAILAIFRNLIQNAVTHGGATEVRLVIAKREEGAIEISIHDNGAGFRGRSADLGKPFSKLGSSSGNGLGLYIVRRLVENFGGKMAFVPVATGFCVKLIFKE